VTSREPANPLPPCDRTAEAGRRQTHGPADRRPIAQLDGKLTTSVGILIGDGSRTRRNSVPDPHERVLGLRERKRMTDLIFVGAVIVFFAASAVYVRACAAL
jgi:hypothetical protein